MILDNRLANRVLDSLQSRAEWEKSYRVLYTQYLLCRGHVNDVDSSAVTANAHCDSLVRNGYAREKELITDNAALTRQLNEEKSAGASAKTERWIWRAVAAAVVTLAILSQ